MIILAHAVLGIAIAYVAGLPVLPALLGAVVVDADFAWAANVETHRSWFHTPFTGALLSVLVFLLLRLACNTARKRKWLNAEPRPGAFSFFLGWMSHITSDALTTYGIMLIFPISTAFYTAGWFRSIEAVPNAAVTVFALVAMWVAFFIRRKRPLPSLGGSDEKQRFLSALIVILVFLLVVERPKSDFPLSAELVSIPTLVANPSSYNDRFVAAEGVVVQILPDYVAKSGRKYKRFYLGDPAENDKILVFKGSDVAPSDVAVGQRLTLSGMLSTKFGEPEIQITPIYGVVRT